MGDPFGENRSAADKLEYNAHATLFVKLLSTGCNVILFFYIGGEL